MTFFKYMMDVGLSLGTGVALAQAMDWCLLKFNVFLPCGWAIGLTVVFSLAVFLVQGLFVCGFLRKKTVLELRNIGSKISVCTGDLFRQEGVIVVAANDFFDTLVDDVHIQCHSIHGQAILRFWPGNVADLDAKLAFALREQPFDLVKRDGKAKEKRYPIGTSVCLVDGRGRKFIFVALTTTDPQTHRASAGFEDLIASIRAALITARNYANGARVLFPLMGSGAAKLNLPHAALFSTLLSTIIAECNVQKVSDEVGVVLYGEFAKTVNYSALKEMWRM